MVDELGRCGGSTNPSDVLSYEGIDEVPAIFLGYTREEIEYRIIIIGVGEDNLSIGINRRKEVRESTREISLISLVGVVNNIAEGTLAGG